MMKGHTVITSIVGEPDADPRHIPESVVQDVWQRQRFQATDLQTTEGDEVVIEDPGVLNDGQGPDFNRARITIAGVTWYGAVEIHRSSSDWYRHAHETDSIYNNVILHATLIADRETGRLRREDGSQIPEIVLLPRLDTSLRRLSWDHLVSVHNHFPCEDHWETIPDSVVDPFLVNLARLRIRRKGTRNLNRNEDVNNLDQILYEETCRALGLMPNAEPMVLLARRVPLRLASKLPSPFHFQCLLLGTSGLLPETTAFVTAHRSAAAYSLRIQEIYRELNIDLGITPMPRQLWRFSRMRPGNFPTLRIAQAAALFGQTGPLGIAPFDQILNTVKQTNAVSQLNKLLTAEPDEYWHHHASLTRRLRHPRVATVGAERRTTVAINAFLPLLASVARDKAAPEIESAVMRCLSELPAQVDSVTRPYSVRRGRPRSATITQGLHELNRYWCTQARCLECPIGKHLLQSGCRFAA